MLKKFNNLFLPSLLISANLFATGLADTFIDPIDNHIDMSNWLLEKKGFLPVPIIITEPAVGYGGGAALVYFHDKFGGQDGKPSVSGIAAAKTENGTWFAGGGHLGIWNNDTIRYVGTAGIGSVNMEYYGLSNGSERINPSIGYTTDFLYFSQEIQFRLGDSNFFAGTSFSLFDTDNTFEFTPNFPSANPLEKSFDNRSSALSLIVTYDSRNNLFSPITGLASKLKASSYNSMWGSDSDYESYVANLFYYTELSDNWMFSTRFDAKAATGDVPFYAFPFIDMRGIKVMQYQGDQTLLSELELAWQFHPRWTIIGFGGVAKAFNSGFKESKDETVTTKGTGIRYLIAKQLGLQMGFDIAKGPDDTAFYIQVGSAWALR